MIMRQRLRGVRWVVLMVMKDCVLRKRVRLMLLLMWSRWMLWKLMMLMRWLEI